MRAPSEFLASLVWEERLTRDGLEVAELLEHQLLGDEVLRTKKARAVRTICGKQAPRSQECAYCVVLIRHPYSGANGLVAMLWLWRLPAGFPRGFV